MREAAEALSLSVVERRWRELVGHGNAQRAEESLRALFADAAAQAPCVVHVRRVASDQDGGAGNSAPAAQRAVDVLRCSLRRIRERRSRGCAPVVVVASTDELASLDVGFRGSVARFFCLLPLFFCLLIVLLFASFFLLLLCRCFDHELALGAPDAAARAALLRDLLPAASARAVPVAKLAAQSAGRCAAELRAIVGTAFARALAARGGGAERAAAAEPHASLQLERSTHARCLRNDRMGRHPQRGSALTSGIRRCRAS